MFSLHGTWFVNSAAHMFGHKPYDHKQKAVENIWVTVNSLGEGFHNYHHKFPSDYATAELPSPLNVSRLFIELMRDCGFAYDLKRTDDDSIEMAKMKTAAQHKFNL